MAEKAVYFTSTYESKPSLFEVIAQKSLDSTFYPAFHKLSEFLAASFPNKLQRIPEYSDEIFLILKGLLEYNYLKKKDATFSEYFYGLKRVPSVDSDSNVKLSSFQVWISLTFSILVPYIKRKVHIKLQEFLLQSLEGNFKSETERRYKQSFITTYKTSEMFWNIWTFAQYLKYICNKTDIQFPQLFLLQLKLVYAQEIFEGSNFWSAIFKKQLSGSEIISGLLPNGLSLILEISAFLLQFIKVWNSEKLSKELAILPEITQPMLDQKSKAYKEKCPICFQNHKIPTVLPISGYVFCFVCIFKQLKEKPFCPVTHLPANVEDLIRIYD